MIGLDLVYPLAGATFLLFAVLGAADRRPWNAAFHALVAASFLLGDRLGDRGNGLLVLALVAVAASGRMRRAGPQPAPRTATSPRLFAVALAVPLTALLGTFLFKALHGLVDPKQATLVSLALGAVLALGLGYAWLRPTHALEPFAAGRALADEVGWAAVLPQMLASLGAVFALAGVGGVVGGLTAYAIPDGSVAGAAVAYGLGMAAFTVVMGNAFAAFPVMAVAVGVPLLVQRHGADPAPVAALGMLAGFCGTLLTPMAANFNLVPAALLELKDRHGVIRAQAPTALALLAFNVALLWWVAR